MLAQALALGALQGPAEMLPVSSSAHMTLVPALLGWGHAPLDPEQRKGFEVALHAGSALALLIDRRTALIRDIVGDRRGVLESLAATAPAVAAGLALERTVERRLSAPRPVAAAQVAAAVALAAADARPATRPLAEASFRDHLAIGAAQAVALVPGVSRSGATLTVGRLLGFERAAASRLSRRAAVPVMIGAATLKGARLARRGAAPGLTGRLAAGFVAAFASTLLGQPLSSWVERPRAWRLLATYRALLGLLVLVGIARGGVRGGRRPRRAVQWPRDPR